MVKINYNYAVDPDKVTLPEDYTEKSISFLKKAMDSFFVDYQLPTSLAVALSGGLDSATALAGSLNSVGKKKTTALVLEHYYETKGEEEDKKIREELIKIYQPKVKRVDITSLVGAHYNLIKEMPAGKQKEILKAESIARARASAIETIASKESLLVIDTSNITEEALGNLTKGDYCGDVGIFNCLFKSEVYALAKSYGLPGFVLEQEKRISELSMTHKQMFGADYRVLEPVIWAYINNISSQKLSEVCGHSIDWIDSIYERVNNSRFRYSADGGPPASIDEYIESNSFYVKGIREVNESCSKKLKRQLYKKRKSYFPGLTPTLK